MVYYHYGPKDLVTILFYIFITIILHAVVQEYILDVSDIPRWRNQKPERCLGVEDLTLEETSSASLCPLISTFWWVLLAGPVLVSAPFHSLL